MIYYPLTVQSESVESSDMVSFYSIFDCFIPLTDLITITESVFNRSFIYYSMFNSSIFLKNCFIIIY